ncbi:family B DNA polymerase, partial [Enterococcus faecium]|uniref:family B DNA polymerase n=1 Tax=Enterococcus faecium TaxID=1352 RepID=UPI0039FCE72B
TRDYYKNPAADRRIKKILSKAKPHERAAFVYMGDLYHLAKYNDEFMRTFIQKMITPVEESEISDEELKRVAKGMDGDMG